MSEGVATPGEVLRRSHRDELLPLAAILRVSPRGRGRDALAMALEQRLHAAGALNPLAVHLRRRAPPSWTEVVGGVATRMELTAGANAVETERRILEAWRGRGTRAHSVDIGTAAGSSCAVPFLRYSCTTSRA